jgi:hypothetical protein
MALCHSLWRDVIATFPASLIGILYLTLRRAPCAWMVRTTTPPAQDKKGDIQMVPDKLPGRKSSLPACIAHVRNAVSAHLRMILHPKGHRAEGGGYARHYQDDPQYRIGHAEGSTAGFVKGLKIGLIVGWVSGAITPSLLPAIQTLAEAVRAGANGWAAVAGLVVMMLSIATGLIFTVIFGGTPRA